MNDAARFEAKIDVHGPAPDHAPELGPCWLWMAAKTLKGYGKFCLGSRRDGSRRQELAHRHAYARVHGPVPSDLCVLHRCDNPRCVNPAHLFLGTQTDNMQDCARKGRLAPLPRRCRLTAHDVDCIRKLFRTGLFLQKELARAFGVERSGVSRIVNGHQWAEGRSA